MLNKGNNTFVLKGNFSILEIDPLDFIKEDQRVNSLGRYKDFKIMHKDKSQQWSTVNVMLQFD